MPQTRDRLLSRKKLAQFLDVSLRTVDRWTKDNFIPHLRIKGRVLYSKKKILKWLEGFEIAGKDWETEMINSGYIKKTDAMLRLRRKKRIRKLHARWDAISEDESLSEVYKSSVSEEILSEIIKHMEKEYMLMEKEIEEAGKLLYSYQRHEIAIEQEEDKVESVPYNSASLREFLFNDDSFLDDF